MKHLITALFAAISLAGYAQNNEHNYNLEITFENDNHNGRKVYLQNFDLKALAMNNIDSTVVDGHKLYLSGTANEPSIKFLAFENEQNAAFVNFVLEAGTINILIDSIVTIEGTPLNNKLNALNMSQFNYRQQVDSLNKVYDQENAAGTFTEKRGEELNEMFTTFTREVKNNIYKFTKENIKNPVGEHYFFTGAGFFDYFDLDQLAELSEMLRPETQDSEVAKQINMLIAINKASQIGQPYTDLRYPNLEGKEVALSDFVGKNELVLVDFWASWCGPCIKEMPHVRELYSQYKDKGLEIVGISLDQDKSAWAAATKRLNITWPQMSDLGGWESKAASAYGVKSIPMTLLLDRDGIIIAKNLRGAELQNKVAEMLN